MKAISIQQPWAWLIIEGHKNIENRGWKTNFRGEVFIHASKTFDKEGYYILVMNEDYYGVKLPSPQSFRYGGVIGKVTIVDCVRSIESKWYTGEYGFVLQNPKRLPFVKMPGKLKFFDVCYNSQQ